MSAPSETIQSSSARLGLAARAAAVGAILFLEKFLLNFFVDFDAAQASTGFGAWVRNAQHWGFRFAVTLAVSLAVFAWIRGDANLRQLDRSARALPLRAPLLLLHFALVLPLVPISHLLYGGHAAPFLLIPGLWLALALAATVALALGFAPWRVWSGASRALGVVWIYAGCAAGLAASAMEWSQQLWAPTATITFDLVRWMLLPFLPNLRADAADLTLYTPQFAVQVAEICSGLEGVGLMLAFCAAWLVYCRRELLFPRVLLLVPLGLLLIFALNVVRIAALMMIGNAGFTDLAVYGFHSQAGWIAFNCAACAIALISRRFAWFQCVATADAAPKRLENQTAAYLLPFLLVLGGGMIVLATSGPSAPWQVVPPLAGALALWRFRRRFATLDWRFSWRAVAAGLAVFVLWMLAARQVLPASATPALPAAAAAPWNALWLLARLLGGVLIVPMTEELAYRGYLLRRLKSQDFGAVRFQAVGLWPVAVSAALFGAAHGTMWAPAVAAGIAYGLLLTRTGHFGEAVTAHAVTNGLIAIAVLFGNHWELWG